MVSLLISILSFFIFAVSLTMMCRLQTAANADLLRQLADIRGQGADIRGQLADLRVRVADLRIQHADERRGRG